MPFTARQLPIAGCLVLLLALIAAVGDAKGADRVDRLPQPVLERAAHRAVAHGRIRSQRWGDATPWLRRLSYELVERAFPLSARAWALCVVRRESGFNPGAVSRTDDHGLPQVNRPSHRWVDYRRITRDPVYAVAVMLRLSDRGANRGPWAGGWSSC